jgi:hypothetical protein
LQIFWAHGLSSVLRTKRLEEKMNITKKVFLGLIAFVGLSQVFAAGKIEMNEYMI